ncbi:erythromycin esterase family protein [Paenibacillus eucommiae]|uniref:Erythromycin esterase-like protein n=1 Tax=Paenibacillus eucommiae TaxID=1355755 RepID=A0ABS4IQ47_9BACL|nr:erythromycin esterase family protein [Paenibacillus eucommiae]MBP1989687.1 erythromycin esterase-like protein [Paenibacillus eucommiae]
MNADKIVDRIRTDAVSFNSMEDLDVIMEAIGDAKIVLLGEASHGTSEFYTMRAELSKRLILQKGFDFIAVEGDWPSCNSVNQYIKGASGAAESAELALSDFNRWPTWMWANREVADFVNWLRTANQTFTKEKQIGFYGLDMYSLWESMEHIIAYLEKTGSSQLEHAKKAFECFEPFNRDEQSYGISAGLFGEGCEDEVVQLLFEMNKKRHQHPGSEAALDAEMNTLVALNAEKYYRTMVMGGPESWNVRDQHMVEVLKRTLNFHGQDAKAIVWEHNTHIGDARATDMAGDGMVNVGQLIREDPEYKQVFALGFGTYQGQVLAGRAWGSPVEVMDVPKAINGSWEDCMHQAGQGENQLLLFNKSQLEFQEVIGHRAIGVVYDPNRELGNYVPSRMAQRYDAYIHLDETTALRPLILESVNSELLV